MLFGVLSWCKIVLSRVLHLQDYTEIHHRIITRTTILLLSIHDNSSVSIVGCSVFVHTIPCCYQLYHTPTIHVAVLIICRCKYG